METEYRAILERLVGFETTPDRSNLPLVEWLADRLDHRNVTVEVLPSPGTDRANLLARIGPSAPGGIVLSGHTDVVTAEGQDWRYEPFEVTEVNGRLYGRGTADMKGFVALATGLAPWFATLPLRRPIYLAFTHDEETGCLGIPHLIDHIERTCEKPAMAIVGEPTNLEAVSSHKGMHLFRTQIIGKEAHSSSPDLGASATVAAGRLVAFLDDYFNGLQSSFPPDDRFDPPHSTCNIGRIDGGIATSFVANRCRIDWEFRTLPDVPSDAILEDTKSHIDHELLPYLRRTHPAAEIELNCWAQVPALRQENHVAITSFVRHLTGGSRQGAVSYGTEAGFYQRAGISSIVCGPGSIAQAHKADEFVTIDQLEAGNEMLAKVAAWACDQH